MKLSHFNLKWSRKKIVVNFPRINQEFQFIEKVTVYYRVMKYHGDQFVCATPGQFALKESIWKEAQETTLLRILSVGICSSDYSRLFNGSAYSYPLTPGHEIYAKVVTPGAESLLKENDLVSVFPLIPCQQCNECKRKDFQLCISYSYYGSRTHGGLSSYLNVQNWNLRKLEKELPNRIGNQVEPLSVVIHAFKQLKNLDEIANLAILGGGFLSYLAIHVAKTLQIKNVYLMTSSDERRSFFSNFAETPAQEKVKQNFFDAAIDFSGNSTMLDSCMKWMCKKSQIVLAANGRPDTKITPYAWDLILRGELSLKGTWNSKYLGPNELDDWSISTSLLKSNSIPDLYPHHEVLLKDLPSYLTNEDFKSMRKSTTGIIPRLSVNINER